MGRFHRLPQLDHPNLIQRKAISGGSPASECELTTPKQSSKAPGAQEDEGEQVRRACPGPAHCFLECGYT